MTTLDPRDWAQFHYRAELETTDTPGLHYWHTTASYPADADIDWPDTVKADGALRVLTLYEPKQPWHDWVAVEMTGVVVDLARVDDDIVEALAGWSRDARDLGAALFTNHDFTPKAQEALDFPSPGRRAILVQDLRSAPAWRGHGGIGRVAAARMLDLLCDNPSVIAAVPRPVEYIEQHPHNTDFTSDLGYAREMAKTRHIWESIGFDRLTDKVWVLDPTLVTHEKGVTTLIERLPTHPR